MRPSFKLAALASSALAALSLAAFAAPVAAQDEGGAATVGEVTVIAQLVEEDIQDVPTSETVIAGERLDVIRSSGGDIRVFSARVPSLTMESSFGRTFPRPYIRGLGNTDFDLNASQPVSIVYDGVVLENPILKGMPLFDIAQVEVLRGPQGTLFGRNTPAGVLMFESRRPSQTFGAEASASVGSFQSLNAEAAVGGPLVDGVLAGRLSGMVQSRSDWVDNTFFGADNAAEGYLQYAGRAQLLWTPNEDVSVLFSAHAMHLDGTPRVFRANIIQPGTNDFVPGFNRAVINQDAQQRAFQEVDIVGGLIRLDWAFGDLTLTSITGYESAETLSRGDIDGGAPNGPGFIPFQAESADGLREHSQWTQEVRLAGDHGALRYVVGAFYFNEDVVIDSFDYFPNDFLEAQVVQNQETTTWAVFTNITYDFTPQLTGAVGLRYTDEEKDFDAQRLFSAIFGPTPLRVVNTEADNVSWNVSLTYAVNDDVNVYGRVATGFRAPAIQGRLLFGEFPSVADTETAISYEAGIKSYLFDRRVRANAAVFYYQVEDIQLTAVGGAANFNQLINAEQATGYGFELDLEARPTDRLLLTAGLSYNHTELDDPGLAVAPCGNGCTVLDPAGVVPGTVVIDGNSLPNAPRWIANVTARYGIPFREGEFFVFTDWAYRSKVNFFLYESAEYSDDSLLEGGLRVGYSYNDGDWEVAAFVRNITNNLSLEGGIDFNNLTGFVNDPRTAGVEVRVRLR